MRLSRLLLALFLVLVAGRTAASQDSKPQDNGKPTPKSDYIRPWTNITDSAIPAEGVLSAQSTSENLCYALNTYIMARETKHSDATHLVAHRTCTPANRFQMKSAIVVPKPQD